jgi:TolB-like protein/class 3 adenylate cyclase/Flp pilus assembly protein TadD
MGETRKLAAILVSDVVGFSRLAGADEDRTLARLRTLRSDLIDPTISVHHGRIVKRTGDGAIVEFRSVVDAVRCAIEVQNGMRERNAGAPDDQKIQFRVGIHLGDVVEEEDGDLMGDGVNIAARLEGLVQPGGICLSEDAYRQVRDRLKEEFVDLGDKELKNIARPMRVYSVKTDSECVVIAPHDTNPNKAGPPRLSIVVLPFANMGDDPEQEYFVDGVTESLTTDLSRIRGSFVIARNTAFTFKGKPLDVKQIGRELNVRYVVEGSVQRGSNRMRVNVQLVDTESGSHLWAERFDRPRADLLDLQDEIVARLANALNTQLVTAESRRAEQAPNPDSTDLYFRGTSWINRGYTPDYMTQARGYFERAWALDPNNVDALVGIAAADATVAGTFFPVDRAARFTASEAALTKALSLAPEHALAHFLLAYVQVHTNRSKQGIAELEKALLLDRNLAGAHAYIGLAKIAVNRDAEAETHVKEALRLSPRDARAFSWLAIPGYAKFYLGNDEEAVEWLQRSIETNRNYPLAHFWIAAPLAHLGRQPDARAAVEAGLALDPKFSIAGIRAGALSDNPAYLAKRERLYDGMRKAGVPEG